MQRHYLTLSTGVLEVTDRVPKEGWELSEKAEEGAVGSGSMTIDDPDMDLVLQALRPYVIVEDTSEATDDVLWSGYTGEDAVGRITGDRVQPLRRAWQVELFDRNSLWNRRVMVGSDCDRSVENDTTRMAWLLTTTEANFIDDATSYVLTASPAEMDARDYRGQFLNQIIGDAAQHTGKNWWLQGQETGTGRVIVAWYGWGTGTTYSSSLSLTNDLADVTLADMEDGTSLVWPIDKVARLARDPSRLYTGVYLRYGDKQAIYRRNPDVDEPTSPLYHVYRDFVADYPNIATKAKAEARATRLLADVNEPNEIITGEVELPAAKATMLKAGMRVQVKLTHLPGYTTAGYLRVLETRISPVSAGTRYRIGLTLGSVKVTSVSGRGSVRNSPDARYDGDDADFDEAQGNEGPWWAGGTLTIDGLSGDQLVVWTDSGNAPMVTGSATVALVATQGGVYLITWTADGTLVIEDTPYGS